MLRLNLLCRLLDHRFNAIPVPELRPVGSFLIGMDTWRCERCGIEMLEAAGERMERLFRRISRGSSRGTNE